jgi:hypothetical protein
MGEGIIRNQVSNRNMELRNSGTQENEEIQF